jgi:hypothetical protein
MQGPSPSRDPHSRCDATPPRLAKRRPLRGTRASPGRRGGQDQPSRVQRRTYRAKEGAWPSSLLCPQRRADARTLHPRVCRSPGASATATTSPSSRRASLVATSRFVAAVDRSPPRPCSEHRTRRDPGARRAMQDRESRARADAAASCDGRQLQEMPDWRVARARSFAARVLVSLSSGTARRATGGQLEMALGAIGQRRGRCQPVAVRTATDRPPTRPRRRAPRPHTSPHRAATPRAARRRRRRATRARRCRGRRRRHRSCPARYRGR